MKKKNIRVSYLFVYVQTYSYGHTYMQKRAQILKMTRYLPAHIDICMTNFFIMQILLFQYYF